MDAHAYIIAGPNGAGKTTFARDFLPKYARCLEFLNVDLMAAGLSPFDPDSAAIAAGRLLLSRMRELIQQERSFAFETTLAGRSYVRILHDMKRRGYHLHLFYLWLPNVELAIARVARRVEQGGHNVAEEVIRRRFSMGMHNLVEFYLPLFDAWMLFDSSTPHPRKIACYDGEKTQVLDADVYERSLGTNKERKA
ncbi:MAG: zeta toxin family protein [Thermoguttaceae bacterium]